jgi:hypothetical protein
MYAIVVRETGDAARIDRGGDHVTTNVAPRLREAPGFVTAMWLSDGAGNTLNVLAFETEEAARNAIGAARNAPRPEFLAVKSADIYRVLATA